MENSNSNKHLHLYISAARIIVGLFFIFSAYTKLFPIDEFEQYIFGHKYIGVETASLLAVGIISAELILGLFFLFNIKIRSTSYTTLGVLIIFSGYLTYLLIKEPESNCYCLGADYELSPLHSILKNLLLSALVIFIALKKTQNRLKFQNILFILLLIIGIATPILLSPPDFIVKNRYSIHLEDKNINISELAVYDSLETKTKINEGNKILCFFSHKCTYCEKTAKKLSMIAEKENIKEGIVLIFYETDNVKEGWTLSDSLQFKQLTIPKEQFFKYSGKRLPAVFYTQNGKLFQKVDYRGIQQYEVIDFLFKK